jgi:hypothetical protein
VVQGTAAPVITVAAVVAYGQVGTDNADRLTAQSGESRIVPHLLTAVASMLMVCILLQAAVLSEALESLARERDIANLQVAFALTGGGVFLLLLAGTLTVVVAAEVRRTRRSVAPELSIPAAHRDENGSPVGQLPEPGPEEPRHPHPGELGGGILRTPLRAHQGGSRPELDVPRVAYWPSSRRLESDRVGDLELQGSAVRCVE